MRIRDPWCILQSISQRLLPIKTSEDILIVVEAFAKRNAWQRHSLLMTGHCHAKPSLAARRAEARQNLLSAWADSRLKLARKAMRRALLRRVI